MPKNKIEDLRNILFETMERLMDDDDTAMDLERAETIAKVGQTIINSAKIEVDFIKHTGAGGSSFIQGDRLPAGRLKPVAIPSALPPIEITAEIRDEDLCLSCPLPECNDQSANCLIQIRRQKAA